MPHPDDVVPKKETGADDSPRFGRLLIVLAIAVLFVVLLTFAAEAYYTP